MVIYECGYLIFSNTPWSKNDYTVIVRRITIDKTNLDINRKYKKLLNVKRLLIIKKIRVVSE